MKFLRKNLLIITDVMEPGGVDTYVKNIIRELSNQWNIYLALDVNSETTLINFLTTYREDIIFKLLNIQYKTTKSSIIKKNIIKIIEEFPPAIVHVVCGSPKSAIVIREQVILMKIPLVTTLQYIPFNYRPSHKKLLSITEITKNTSNTIFVSNWEQAKFFNIFSSFNFNSTVIYNSIYPKTYLKKINYRNIQKRKIVLGFIGRLDQQKGLDRFICCLKEIINELNSNVEFLIFGAGKQERKLKSIVQRLNLNEIISFKGWTCNLKYWYKAIDYFVYPSLDEGLPFSVLEAMVYGNHIITSDIGCHREILNNGMYGKLIDFNNDKSANELMVALTKINIKKNERRKRNEWINTKFNVITNMQKLNKIYIKALKHYIQE